MYRYKLKITKIYDGDTLNGTVDLGFNVKIDIKVRLARINTPEIRTKNAKEKKKGFAARDFLKKTIQEHTDEGYIILINTNKKGKYGRWVSEIIINDGQVDILNINDFLVEQGHAKYKEY
jgi:micrococcal nuclease